MGFRAGLQRLVPHGLEKIEVFFALLALVFVSRHNGLVGYYTGRKREIKVLSVFLPAG